MRMTMRQDRADALTQRQGSPRVSVVIPNWNGARWLDRCLRALRVQRFEDFEILIVDNGSTDDSRARVEQCCPEAIWIGLSTNRGFSAAVNVGIRAARGELVALLNNDTEADPGWLEALVEGLDRRPDMAFAASRMREDPARERLYNAGGAMRWDGIPVPYGGGEMDDGRFDTEQEVFWACAGAALYRRSLFDRIGLFEESFFAYFEDVDLCFRAQLAGYRGVYVPGAVIYHVGAATSGQYSDLTLRLYLRNRLLLAVRNYPWPYFGTKLPNLLRLSGYWPAQVAWRERRFRILLQAGLEFLSLLPGALAARRRIQRQRRISLADLDQALTGIADAALGDRKQDVQDRQGRGGSETE